jgi:hypothetical protein
MSATTDFNQEFDLTGGTPPTKISETLMSTSSRRLIGTINGGAGALALVALVATYGLAERLVTLQEAADAGTLATQTVGWLGPDFAVTLSMSLLMVGAAAGAVGSVIQQSIIFALRAGHETLERGFVWWYLLRPMWSALLGAVVVVAFNAGLVSIGDTTTSTAGVTVLVTAGAVAGLFTDKALQRLSALLGASACEVPATTLSSPTSSEG